MIISMNGDAQTTLVEQMGELGIALSRLEIALGKALPHGRNYPGQMTSPCQYDLDREQHAKARKAVDDLNSYYVYACNEISKAMR